FSHIDRSAFTDNSELNVELLIENLKNVIMKKLFILCMTESSVSLSVLSISFSAAFSQSLTSASVSDSPALTTPVSVISGFAASAFIINSPHFKKILYRLNESYLSAYTLLSFLLTSRIIYYIKTVKNICVFRNENIDVILFYICRYEAFASVSEIILIKDDNIIKTIFSHFQASSITFSLFSAEKALCTLNCK
ncbi:hypothetical protein BDFG_07391, partial [Blastomyces dermatitidis ATCC 26199]